MRATADAEVSVRILLAALVCSALLPAQPAKSAASYAGQTWVGLLVSASCDASRLKKGIAADTESDLTTANRVTTPAVDSGGTRGQGEVQEPGSNAPQHNVVPKTGDVHDRTKAADPDWKAAQKQAARLGDTCGVDASTQQFALILPDGHVLRFDDLASQGIAKQLKARAAGHKSIYRVQAAGKLQNGRIALDTIQM